MKKENLSDDTKRLIEMSFVVMSSKIKKLSFVQCFESCIHEYYLKRIENQDENKNSLSTDKIFRISIAIYKQFHAMNEIQNKHEDVFFIYFIILFNFFVLINLVITKMKQINKS